MDAEIRIVDIFGIWHSKLEGVSGKEILFQSVLVPRHHSIASHTIHCFVGRVTESEDSGKLHSFSTETDGLTTIYKGVEHTVLLFRGDNSVEIPEGYEVTLNSA